MRKTGGLRSYIAYFKKLSFIYVTPLKFLPFFLTVTQFFLELCYWYFRNFIEPTRSTGVSRAFFC